MSRVSPTGGRVIWSPPDVVPGGGMSSASGVVSGPGAVIASNLDAAMISGFKAITAPSSGRPADHSNARLQFDDLVAERMYRTLDAIYSFDKTYCGRRAQLFQSFIESCLHLKPLEIPGVEKLFNRILPIVLDTSAPSDLNLVRQLKGDVHQLMRTSQYIRRGGVIDEVNRVEPDYVDFVGLAFNRKSGLVHACDLDQPVEFDAVRGRTAIEFKGIWLSNSTLARKFIRCIQDGSECHCTPEDDERVVDRWVRFLNQMLKYAALVRQGKWDDVELHVTSEIEPHPNMLRLVRGLFPENSIQIVWSANLFEDGIKLDFDSPYGDVWAARTFSSDWYDSYVVKRLITGRGSYVDREAAVVHGFEDPFAIFTPDEQQSAVSEYVHDPRLGLLQCLNYDHALLEGFVGWLMAECDYGFIFAEHENLILRRLMELFDRWRAERMSVVPSAERGIEQTSAPCPSQTVGMDRKRRKNAQTAFNTLLMRLTNKKLDWDRPTTIGVQNADVLKVLSHMHGRTSDETLKQDVSALIVDLRRYKPGDYFKTREFKDRITGLMSRFADSR